MDALEVKEEHMVDVNINQGSYDEFPSEPEEDPPSTETETTKCSFVPGDLVALDKLAKLLASFPTTKPPCVIDSNKTTIQIEATSSVDAIALSNDEMPQIIYASNDEIISSKNTIESSNIKVINICPIKADSGSCTDLTDGNKKAVLAVAQCLDGENGRITRKWKASNNSAPQTLPKHDLELYNTFGLKTLTVNIGPRVHLPLCLQSNLKLKIYSCRKCSSKFTDSVAYKAHLVSCGNNLNKSDEAILYHCGICIYKFKKITNLQNHMIKHPCKNFTCTICLDGFSTIDELRVHNYETHKAKSLKKIYACNVCNYSTTKYFHLKEHLIQHIPDKHIFCSRCRHNCDDEADYSEHWAKLHSSVSSKKRKRINSEHDPVQDKILKQGTLQNVDNIVHNDADFNNDEQSVNYIVRPVTDNHLENLCSSYESEIITIEGFYYCSTCVYKFSKLENLMKHMKQHIATQSPFKCYQCKYESFSIVNMEKHCKQMCHKMTGKCNECSCKYEKWRSVKRHVINHIYDGLFCYQCFLNFENYELYKDHMFLEHSLASMENMYSCNKCSYKHPNEIAYRIHLKKSHLGERKLAKKKLCKKPVKTKLAQDEENIVRSSEKITIQSQTIGAYSTNEFNAQNRCLDKNVCLRRTFGDPTSHKPLNYQYKCAKCNFTTNEFGSFMKHSLNHKNLDKPLQCNVCLKQLSSLELYLKHMRSHDGISVYECLHCKYPSINEAEFRKHAANHECYTCPMCVYKTCNIKLFKKHTEKQHKPGRVFSCPLCPHSVNVKQSLSLHCLRFHPQQFCKIKLFVPQSLSYEHENVIGCKRCSFTCKKSRIYDLKRHLVTHFTNGSLNKLKSKGLGFKRTKQPTLGLKEHSKLTKTNINNRDKHSICYHCSKCNKKSKHRSIISVHLRNQHNIIGGVRDNMILKVQIQPPDYIDQKSEVLTDLPPKHTPEINESESSNTLKSESNDSTVQIEDTNEVALNSKSKASNKSLYYSCGECSMISRHRSSVHNHLKCVHKIVSGDIKNNMIKKIWRNKSMDKKENKPTIRNHSIYYKCSQCDFKSSKLRPTYNHLHRSHKIFGGVKNSKILKVYGRADVLKHENETIYNSKLNILNKTKKKPRTKQPTLGLKEHSKLTKTNINNRDKHSICYHCSKCNKKSKHRSIISVHLRIQHNIIGGVRDNMILKVQIQPPDYIDQKSEVLTDLPPKHTPEINESESSNTLKSESNDSTVQIEDTNEVALNSKSKASNKYLYYSCGECSMISRHRSSVHNHLKCVHKIVSGDIKNNMIKKIWRNKSMDKKENKPTIRNHSIYYKCSQCDFKSSKLRPTYNHLHRSHKIFGGVKDSKILKVYGRADVLKHENETIYNSKLNILNKIRKKPTTFNESTSPTKREFLKPDNRKQKIETIPNSNRQTLNLIMKEPTNSKERTSPSKQDLLHPVENKSITTTQTSPNHYNCSLCNMKTKYINTFKAHLRRHKRGGALKTRNVSKVFNDQPKLYVDQISTCSPLSSFSTTELITNNIDDLQARNKEEQSNTHVIEETKQTPPSMSFNSRSMYFSCLLCPYKNKLRPLLFDHLSKYHNVKREVRMHWISQCA